MSAKAKARFAVGFVLAILIAVIAILAFSITSNKLFATDEVHYSVDVMKVEIPCQTGGGSGGSAVKCYKDVKYCKVDAGGSFGECNSCFEYIAANP